MNPLQGNAVPASAGNNESGIPLEPRRQDANAELKERVHAAYAALVIATSPPEEDTDDEDAPTPDTPSTASVERRVRRNAAEFAARPDEPWIEPLVSPRSRAEALEVNIHSSVFQFPHRFNVVHFNMDRLSQANREAIVDGLHNPHSPTNVPPFEAFDSPRDSESDHEIKSPIAYTAIRGYSVPPWAGDDHAESPFPSEDYGEVQLVLSPRAYLEAEQAGEETERQWNDLDDILDVGQLNDSPLGPNDIPATWFWDVPITLPWRHRGVGRGAYITYNYHDKAHTCTVYTGHGDCDLINDLVDDAEIPEHAMRLLRVMARPVSVTIHAAPPMDDGRFPPGSDHGEWWPRVAMVDVEDIALGIIGPGDFQHGDVPGMEGRGEDVAIGLCGYPVGHALFAQPREECVCNRFLLNAACYAKLLTHPNLTVEVLERFASLQAPPVRFQVHQRPASQRFVMGIPRLLTTLPTTAARFFGIVSKNPDVEASYVAMVVATALEELTLLALGVASPWLAAAGALALAVVESYHVDTPMDKWFKLCAHVGLAGVRHLSGLTSWMIHAMWNAMVFICSEINDEAYRPLLLSGKMAGRAKYKKNNPKADANGRRTVPPPSRSEKRFSKQAEREYIANRPLQGVEPDSGSDDEVKVEDVPDEGPLDETAWVYFPTSPGLGTGPMTMHLSNGETIRHMVQETEHYPSLAGCGGEWAELCLLADAILCNNTAVVVNPTPCAYALILWLTENYEVKVDCWVTTGRRMAPPSNSAYGDPQLPTPPLKLGFAYHFDKAFTGPVMGMGNGLFRHNEPTTLSVASGMGPLTLEEGAEHYRTTSHPSQGFYSPDEIDFSHCIRVRLQPVFVRDPRGVAGGAMVRVNTFECRDYVSALPCALHYLDGADFPVKVGPAYRNSDGSTFYPYRLLRDVPHPFGLIDLRVLVESSKSPQIKSGNESAWSVAAHRASAAMTTQPGAARDALVATAIAVLAYAETRKDMRASVTAAVLNGTIKFDQIGRGWRELFAGRADVLPRAEAFMAMHPGVANLLNWVVSHSLSPYGGWMLALLQAIVGFIPSLYPRCTFKQVMGKYLEPSELSFEGHQSCCYIEREARNFIPTKQPDFNDRAAPIDPDHDFIMKRTDDLMMSVDHTPMKITHTRQITFNIHTLESKEQARPCFLAGPLCLHAAATYSSMCTVPALCLRQGLERPPFDSSALTIIEAMGQDYLNVFFNDCKNDLEVDPLDYDRWLSCQKPNVRREHNAMTEAGTWPAAENCDVDGTAFTKTELHKPVAPSEEPGLPRVIVDSRADFNRYTAPDVYRTYHSPEFGEAFNGARKGSGFRHLYSPGCKGETLCAHFLEQCEDEGEGGMPCLVVLGDVTKWDAHIRPAHIRVMLHWYRRMGFSEQALRCFERKMTSSATVRPTGKNFDQGVHFTATLDGTVKSGVPDTTFGNTLFNIFLMAYCVGAVVNGHSDYKRWLYIPSVTASGDDSVVVVHRDGKALRGYLISTKASDAVSFNAAVTNVCLSLGFRVKVHTNLHGINGISYCGGRFYPVMRKTITWSPPFAEECGLAQKTGSTYYAFGNSVKRQLFKCGFISQPHWEHATAVWAGTMVQQAPLYNHVPILGTFWRAQLPIAKTSRQEKPVLEDHKILNTYRYEPLSYERSFRYDYLVDDDGEPFTFGDYTLSQAHNLIEQRYGTLADALMPDRTLVLADPLITSALRGSL